MNLKLKGEVALVTGGDMGTTDTPMVQVMIEKAPDVVGEIIKDQPNIRRHRFRIILAAP